MFWKKIELFIEFLICQIYTYKINDGQNCYSNNIICVNKIEKILKDKKLYYVSNTQKIEEEYAQVEKFMTDIDINIAIFKDRLSKYDDLKHLKECDVNVSNLQKEIGGQQHCISMQDIDKLKKDMDKNERKISSLNKSLTKYKDIDKHNFDFELKKRQDIMEMNNEIKNLERTIKNIDTNTVIDKKECNRIKTQNIKNIEQLKTIDVELEELNNKLLLIDFKSVFNDYLIYKEMYNRILIFENQLNIYNTLINKFTIIYKNDKKKILDYLNNEKQQCENILDNHKKQLLLIEKYKNNYENYLSTDVIDSKIQKLNECKCKINDIILEQNNNIKYYENYLFNVGIKERISETEKKINFRKNEVYNEYKKYTVIKDNLLNAESFHTELEKN